MLILFMLQYECLMKRLKLYFALVIPGWKCGMRILFVRTFSVIMTDNATPASVNTKGAFTGF